MAEPPCGEVKANRMSNLSDSQKREAYARYCQTIQDLYKGLYNPVPLEQFKFQTCVLCTKTIVDDPYGHNAYPLASSGKCCSSCNRLVFSMRLLMHQAQTVCSGKSSGRR